MIVLEELGTIDQGFVNINNPFNSQLSSTSRAKTVQENHKYVTTNHKFYRMFSHISIFLSEWVTDPPLMQ